jgi:hypothetical protein
MSPDGTFEGMQTGLINKTIDAAGLLDCNSSGMPPAQNPIGRDVNREKHEEDWHHASIVSMLQCLQPHTKPNITL